MFKTVSQKVRKERLAICATCEFFVKQITTCKSCGCYMPAKVTFAVAECPEGKWVKNQPDQNLINKIEEMILQSWDKE